MAGTVIHKPRTRVTVLGDCRCSQAAAYPFEMSVPQAPRLFALRPAARSMWSATRSDGTVPERVAVSRELADLASQLVEATPDLGMALANPGERVLGPFN